uniref:receptor protein serine/threonine kinase n=1 Tax=Halisarca dujardinii TaxID=2583056 RepID=A0A8F8FKB0_HALDU|nr:TGF-beta receptor type I HduTGFbRId [Halisarca dujardinii]
MWTIVSMELLAFILLEIIISHISPMSNALMCNCNSTRCGSQTVLSCPGLLCAVVRDSSSKIELSCLSASDCDSSSPASVACCNTSYCNKPSLLYESAATVASDTHLLTIIMVGCIAMVLLCVVGIGISVVIFRSQRLKKCWQADDDTTQVGVETGDGPQTRNCVEAIVPSGQSVSDLIDQAAQPPNCGQLSLWMQKNIVRATSTSAWLHTGQSSDVHRGTWREEEVMVKVYPSQQQEEWYKEVGTYQKPHLHHEHVLQFIAADHKQSPRGLECWLVTVYHPHGSLRDYLLETSLEVRSCVRMCWSVASGLAFLHQFRSTLPHDKPCIVHRNLTSSNVLVKSNGECCLADLSSCVSLSSPHSELQALLKVTTQDMRYRPPEFLAPSDAPDEGFHAHMRGDVYSLGLVLWEICRRCSVKDVFSEALLPYEEAFPGTFTQGDAFSHVSLKEQRPSVPQHWCEHKVFKPLTATITDCWTTNSLSRPQVSAVRDLISDFICDHNSVSHSILSEKCQDSEKVLVIDESCDSSLKASS